MVTVIPEPPDAAPNVEDLLDRAFGPGRRTKTAERLREGRQPADSLAYIAADEGELVGTIRFWHVRIGAAGDALLLGPVAVAPEREGRGIGAALIRRGLRAARALGHRAVILVGDEPYYRRFGFRAEATRELLLPGPMDRRRFLGLDLVPDALLGARGLVLPGTPITAARRAA